MLSSKMLEDELNEIRKNFTPSLGGPHGRVVLKAQKQTLEARLKTFRANLTNHQHRVENELQCQLDKSRKQIVDYYQQHVVDNPPDALLGQLLQPKPTKADARLWLESGLDVVFPDASTLINKMQLEVRYKDVTFETLKDPDFLVAVKKAFRRIDWDKAYDEFRAAGEAQTSRSGTTTDASKLT